MTKINDQSNFVSSRQCRLSRYQLATRLICCLLCFPGRLFVNWLFVVWWETELENTVRDGMWENCLGSQKLLKSCFMGDSCHAEVKHRCEIQATAPQDIACVREWPLPLLVSAKIHGSHHAHGVSFPRSACLFLPSAMIYWKLAMINSLVNAEWSHFLSFTCSLTSLCRPRQELGKCINHALKNI